MFYTRKTCRLCDSTEVSLAFKMPAMPPVDNYRLPGDAEIVLPAFPMDLYMCRSCGHAQLLDVVEPDILFGNYIYTSSSSPDLNAHFENYVTEVLCFLNKPVSLKILDVGSNDGLLLSKFKSRGHSVCGVDPSEAVGKIARAHGIETHIGYLNLGTADQVVKQYGHFDLVTANNVFSHADNLREFAEAVASLMSPNGTFVFEVSYLKDLVEKSVIDYVYHEHLCHHSIKPLKPFLALCGLKLINVERIATKGGSIRCYASKASSAEEARPIVQTMIDDEVATGLYDLENFRKLNEKITRITARLQEICDDVLKNHGVIALYGASATATVLNYLLGINRFAGLIIDDNPSRQNRLSPGFMIPVLPASSLLAHGVTTVIISAWRFADLIIERNKPFLDKGGIFIIPFPELRIIKR
jgi:SAM-dependent methyltransferase